MLRGRQAQSPRGMILIESFTRWFLARITDRSGTSTLTIKPVNGIARSPGYLLERIVHDFWSDGPPIHADRFVTVIFGLFGLP